MRCLLLLVLFVFAVPAVAAQPLPTGTWTGILEWSNAAPVALTAALEACVEGLKLTLRSEDGAYHAEEVVRVEEDAVRFGVTNTRRSYTLACNAERQPDGALSGMCRAATGAHAHLRLQPPAHATIGCSE